MILITEKKKTCLVWIYGVISQCHTWEKEAAADRKDQNYIAAISKP